MSNLRKIYWLYSILQKNNKCYRSLNLTLFANSVYIVKICHKFLHIVNIVYSYFIMGPFRLGAGSTWAGSTWAGSTLGRIDLGPDRFGAGTTGYLVCQDMCNHRSTFRKVCYIQILVLTCLMMKVSFNSLPRFLGDLLNSILAWHQDLTLFLEYENQHSLSLCTYLLYIFNLTKIWCSYFFLSFTNSSSLIHVFGDKLCG